MRQRVLFPEGTLPRLRLAAGVGLSLLLAWAAGCGGPGGPERAVVSGSVTYDGKPVDDGMIRFVPAEGTKAPSSGAVIKGGRYTANSQGGVAVGTYSVEILGNRPDPSASSKAEVPGVQGPATIQYIPEKYNQNSQLKVTIKPKSRSVQQDFQLEK